MRLVSVEMPVGKEPSIVARGSSLRKKREREKWRWDKGEAKVEQQTDKRHDQTAWS